MEHALTAYRKKHGLSRKDLAKRAGTTRQTIHRIENGEQFPSVALIDRLIAATEDAVDVRAFLPSAGRAA